MGLGEAEEWERFRREDRSENLLTFLPSGATALASSSPSSILCHLPVHQSCYPTTLVAFYGMQWGQWLLSGLSLNISVIKPPWARHWAEDSLAHMDSPHRWGN